MKTLQIKSGRVREVEIPLPTDKTGKGKSVIFIHGGKRIVGVCKAMTAAGPVVDITLPDTNGLLHCTGTEVILGKGTEFEFSDTVSVQDGLMIVKAWEASAQIGVPDSKAFAVHAIPDDPKSAIVDYKDVTFEGYGSTFASTTPKDRDGDYVDEHAFDKTLARFKENPVLLTDHSNSVNALAGSFTKIGVNQKGLAVQGRLSNAPGLRDTRFKIVEGHLKALSMGGLFYYADDGRGIMEVDLFEISLTPAPANPDALFQVRSITPGDAIKCYEKRFKW